MMSPMARYPGPPTILTIFGATGDLSEQKLLPSLFDLYNSGLLPSRFRVVAFSRRPFTSEDFRAFAEGAIRRRRKRISRAKLGRFLAALSYEQGMFGEPASYQNLGEALVHIDDRFGQCSNKLFYLAVPPAFYETIFENLAHSGLTIPCSDEMGWTRVLVEKPFGRDTKTAEKLDRMLGLLFKEEQIFRIDHYLAKETIQNILSFRFSNALFEPIWNHDSIEKIEIRLFEAGGVGKRGSFYDETGALRDVGQNHLLQMLAVITMSNIGILSASGIQKERARILNVLKKPRVEEIVRGQYRGYQEEEGVSYGSKTETYFRLVTYLNDERWARVPFILESGKGMRESTTEIVIYFKQTTTCLCPPGRESIHQNILTFRIQPNEGISIRFWAKKTGFDFELEPKTLTFLYKTKRRDALPDAYERVLFDCIRGDQTLFAGTDEVAAAWRFITPILETWGASPLREYELGSDGPSAGE